MAAKEFLLQECKNLRTFLEKTLRYVYGPDGSKDFYDECCIRLDFIEGELTTATDAKVLTDNTALLNDLARLVCRIERSAIGEYSWPFVGEFKKIATAICRENTLADPDMPNKIYVLGDGGLDSYGIHPEQRRPSASKKRLLTIVIPKSLKHFVLLHSILGHELGHAIWRCSKHQKELRAEVVAHMCDPTGIFASPAATATHLFSATAPQEIKDRLSSVPGLAEANFFSKANWSAWCEEILCDLIGLVTFGPSFLAAECDLLYSQNPTGTDLLPNHPLTAWRINYILDGAKLLGYDVRPKKAHPLWQYVDGFWAHAESFRKSDPWYTAFPTDQLKRALDGVKALLGRHPPSEYHAPDADKMSLLVSQLAKKIPPVGFLITEKRVPKCESVDFRHILYAGWMVQVHHPNFPVTDVNQLCEHAIMQQGAIDIFLSQDDQ